MAAPGPPAGELEAGQDGLSDKLPFTHAKHVPDVWLDASVPERQRDCRGCHDYSLSDGHDPQAVCIECHFSNETNSYSFLLSASDESFLTDLHALRQSGSLFQHSNHLALECRECHPIEGDDIMAPILMPKSGGMVLCLECHVDRKPRQNSLSFMPTWRDGSAITPEYIAEAKGKLPRGLVGALNGSPEMGPNQGDERFVEPFRHADHIPEDNLGRSSTLAQLLTAGRTADEARRANCAACHAPMFSAGAGMAARGEDLPPDQHASFEQATVNCGSCHQSDATGTPIRFELEHAMRPSPVAGTFSHADHLGLQRPSGEPSKSTEAGYASIEEQGCMACHAYDPQRPEGFVLQPAFQGETAIQGCQTCHSTSAWAPASHGDWWLPEDHGSWGNCSQCHSFGDSDFRMARPQTEVQRRSPGKFRIETQSHPLITGAAGDPVDQSCSDCHRQPVTELPSRIQEAAFQHASHLPEAPTSADCARCHGTSVAQAQGSRDIGRRVGTALGLVDVDPVAQGLTYDPGACAECHLGSEPIAEFGPEALAEIPTRRVPEFSHGAHVGRALAGGREVGCADCHVFEAPVEGQVADPSAQIGTLAEAMNCTLCHDHRGQSEPERAALTGGGVTAAEVAACSTCHLGGIPALDSEVLVPTARVADIAGKAGQFHPAEQECTNCHLPDRAVIAAPVASTHSRVFARRSFYKADSGKRQKPAIHRNGTRKLQEDKVTCFACHWTDNLVGVTDSDSAIPNPEGSYPRKKFGDSLEGYPGGLPSDFER